MLDKAKLLESQISFQTRFNMTLMGVDDPLRMLGMEIPSDTAVEKHNWLGAVPGLSAWTDQRKLSSLRAEAITITNQNYASGIRIDKNDIDDDKLGIVAPRIDMLAEKARLHYGDLLVQALVAGLAASSPFGQAYDGQNFFDTDHKDGDGPTQVNLTTAVLASASYFAARARMWSLTDEEGDPLGIVPDTLIVGPTLEKTAREIVEAVTVPNTAGTASQQNVLSGSARVVVSPRLTGSSANFWFLAALNTPIRPLILQVRDPITSSYVGADSESFFMNRELKFGAEGRHAVGYGLWQHIQGSNGTV